MENWEASNMHNETVTGKIYVGCRALRSLRFLPLEGPCNTDYSRLRVYVGFSLFGETTIKDITVFLLGVVGSEQ